MKHWYVLAIFLVACTTAPFMDDNGAMQDAVDAQQLEAQFTLLIENERIEPVMLTAKAGEVTFEIMNRNDVSALFELEGLGDVEVPGNGAAYMTTSLSEGTYTYCIRGEEAIGTLIVE